MKISSLSLLFLFLQLQVRSQSQAELIKKVETSLVPPAYFEGDKKWTIEERMVHYGVPGVSIAVINNSTIEWVKAYGIVDKETREPVTPQTLFQAASISKPVSAYAALKLVEQQKLDLNENVNAYLKSWKLPENEFTASQKVTIKGLVSHSAGVTVHGFLGYSPGLPVPSLLEVLDGKSPANSAPIRIDKTPGESFRYSGGGYCILQQLLIDQENKPFPQIMQGLVFQPLGMSHSTFEQPLSPEKLKLAATGYLPDGSMTKGKRHTYPEMAAAGLWTTAEDLATFAVNIQKTIKGESSKVVSKSMTEQMLTPVLGRIGLGIFIRNSENDIYFAHGGWDEGFSSHLIAHKDKGYGVVVLTNSNHPDFINELMRAVALTYNWDHFTPVYKKIPAQEKELVSVCGRYREHGDGLINISYKDNKLFKNYLGADPVELFKVAENTYVALDNNGPLEFKKTGEGQYDLLIRSDGPFSKVKTCSYMKENEHLPYEYIESGNYDQALKAYSEIKHLNPKDPLVSENRLNDIGYLLLNSGKVKPAKDLFKINTVLYPQSANAYDSYAEACMKNGEDDLAISNYEQSLILNPENKEAVKKINEIKSKKSGTH